MWPEQRNLTIKQILTMKNLKEYYENTYVSVNEFNAEDIKPFKFKIIVTVTNLSDACGEPGYLISVDAAKLPKYLTAKHKKDVKNCMGTDKISVVDVCEYGLSANFENSTVLTESEVNTTLEQIDAKIDVYGMLCGFYFDRVQNRIGNTGWEFLNGNLK